VDAEARASAVELYLLRHAHAGDPAKWQGDDAERPLSEKGRGQAERLGAFLAERRLKPGALLTSPRVRAVETAQIVGNAIGVKPEIDERLAMALDLAGLSEVIDDAGSRRVMLVGHDPDFSDLAATMVGAQSLALRKGALARIDVSLPLEPGAGILRWLLPPDLVARDT
jgi:phosphohistidine phosphatase